MRQAGPSQPLLPAIRRGADGLSFTIAEDWAERVFYHDCPKDRVEFARARLTPQPVAPQATSLDDVPDLDSFEAHYIICDDDRTIPPDYQRHMSRRLPRERVSTLPSSHSPFLSMPDALAERIARILGK